MAPLSLLPSLSLSLSLSRDQAIGQRQPTQTTNLMRSSICSGTEKSLDVLRAIATTPGKRRGRISQKKKKKSHFCCQHRGWLVQWVVLYLGEGIDYGMEGLLTGSVGLHANRSLEKTHNLELLLPTFKC